MYYWVKFLKGYCFLLNLSLKISSALACAPNLSWSARGPLGAKPSPWLPHSHFYKMKKMQNNWEKSPNCRHK